MQPLAVSQNKRFLIKQDGTPFFYLGDTAWELTHRLGDDEIQRYLRNRSGKGFNVVQTVILAECNGLTEPNVHGELPLIEQDPARPNEAYFKRIDWMLDRAAAYGLYVALLPTWGSYTLKENNPFFASIQAFNPQNARIYGAFLGARYRDRTNIVWVLGGDRKPLGVESVWDNMAQGIKSGGAAQIISYHPFGPGSSAEWFHAREWLDFNMIQSGHRRPYNCNYDMITTAYDKTPAKPVLEAEPLYEDICIGFSGGNGFADAQMVRATMYWAVFAGSLGITYGCHPVWQMYNQPHKPILATQHTWIEAINLPGSYQAGYLRRLMESRPILTRIPDQSILKGEVGWGADHMHATRDGTPGKSDATYLMVYSPQTRGITVETKSIKGANLRAWWFDPRTGTPYLINEEPNSGTYSVPWNAQTEHLPGDGPDWVLVVDDADAGYGAPGSAPFGAGLGDPSRDDDTEPETIHANG